MRKNNKNCFSKSKFIKKRGFTLIELIVVMAVIAILVLLAMPKFMNYAEEARVTRIKNDVKVAEDIATEYLVEYEKFPDNWDSISVSELNAIKDENRLYEKKGLATTIQSGEYVAIDKNFVKTKVRSRLKGTFYANLNAKVYYEDSKAGTSSNDDNNDGENNNNENSENWEIVDVGISTCGDGWIKIKSDNDNIKHLVSSQLGDFEFENVDIVDDYESYPIYLVNEFEQFESNQSINNMFGQNLTNFSDDFKIGFSGNQLYKYDYNYGEYNKTTVSEKEILDVKNIEIEDYDWYMVQYIDNTVDLIDINDMNVLESYSEVKNILCNGYIDMDNILYSIDFDNEDYYDRFDGTWELIGGNYVKSLEDEQLYYFVYWEEACKLIGNPVNQNEKKVVSELILLNNEIYLMDWNNIDLDIWDGNEEHILLKFEGIDENIVDLYQEWRYAVAKTESGELIYIDCWDKYGLKIINNNEINKPTISSTLCIIDEDVLDIYSNDLYIDTNGKLINTIVDWTTYDCNSDSFIFLLDFLDEVNNSGIEMVNIINRYVIKGYSIRLIVMDENNNIWNIHQFKGESISYTLIGSIENEDKIEKIITRNEESLIVLTNLGKVYNIFRDSISNEFITIIDLEIENAIDITTDLVLTDNGDLYDLKHMRQVDIDSIIQIDKLLYKNILLDINDNIWIYECDDIIWSYQEFVNEHEDDEDILIIIKESVLKSENSTKVLINDTNYPYSIILDEDNNVWGIGYIVHPRIIISE